MIPVYQEWHILNGAQRDIQPQATQTFSSVIPKKIGVQIHEARIKKRMTIFYLADILQRDSYTIALYENGLETPDKETMQQIQSVLGADFNLS